MDMFKPVSKWQVRVTDPRSLDAIFSQALRVATTGKPGPVVLCVPDDVGSTDVEFGPLPEVNEVPGTASYPRFRMAPDPADLARAVAALAQARRPALLVGGGAHISGCYQQVEALAERLQAPVITSISGKGIISEEHPLAFGVTGTFGSPVARNIHREADLVFFIGCKAGQLTTFNYQAPAAGTPLIHLEIDPEEVGRNFPGSLPLIADAAVGLDAVLGAGEDLQPSTGWDLAEYAQDRAHWYQEMTDPTREPTAPLRAQAIMGVVNEYVTDTDTAVADASLASGWAACYLTFASAGRRSIAPRGLAGLGWGSPAAVGAALARENQGRILHFAGDGGFGYSLQEMEVMTRAQLPVLTFIFNNDHPRLDQTRAARSLRPELRFHRLQPRRLRPGRARLWLAFLQRHHAGGTASRTGGRARRHRPRPHRHHLRPVGDPRAKAPGDSGRAAAPRARTGPRLQRLGASQGRQDVRQGDAEVVFLGGLKNREKQLVGIPAIHASEVLHLARRGTAGHPMPVDRRRRIARA